MREKTDNLIFNNISLLLKTSKITPVILCIGSDRVTGDCLGPLVGHLLKNNLNINAYVYGSLSSPVNALNLVETVNFIKAKHVSSPIIAIDSSLGNKAEIGSIRFIADGIHPGAGIGKNLPKVGDYSITATVAEIKKNDLYSVRLGFIFELANKIASTLDSCFCTVTQKLSG